MNCSWAGVMRFLEVSRTLCHHPSITGSCTQIVPVEAWGAGRETDDQTLITEQQPHCSLIFPIPLSLCPSLSVSLYHSCFLSLSLSLNSYFTYEWFKLPVAQSIHIFLSLPQVSFFKYLNRFVLFLIVNSTLYPAHICPPIHQHSKHIYSLPFSRLLCFLFLFTPLHSASLPGAVQPSPLTFFSMAHD